MSADEGAVVPAEPGGKVLWRDDPDRQPRGYSWPPFEIGNEVALQHGARSPRRVDPLARQFVDSALEMAREVGSTTAFLLEPSFGAELWAWGRAEAQVQLFTEYLLGLAELAGNDVGDLDADRVKTAYMQLHRAETRAASARSNLGLTPLARARLGRDVAAGSVDIAKLMAKLAEAEATGS